MSPVPLTPPEHFSNPRQVPRPRSLPAWRFDVTARDIRRFRQAIDDPGDETLAPPLFCQVMAYRDADLSELPPDASPLELRTALEDARTVGGASDWLIQRCVRAGERIEVRVTQHGATRKVGRRGPLDVVDVETRFIDADGALVAREHATYLQRASA